MSVTTFFRVNFEVSPNEPTNSIFTGRLDLNPMVIFEKLRLPAIGANSIQFKSSPPLILVTFQYFFMLESPKRIAAGL